MKNEKKDFDAHKLLEDLETKRKEKEKNLMNIK